MFMNQNDVNEAKEKMNLLVDDVSKSAGRLFTWSIQRTRELKFYLFKFAIRLAIFLAIAVLYIRDRDFLIEFMNRPFFSWFTPLHLVWGLFMAIMISHLIPNNRLSMAWRKARENVYRPVKNYDRLKLLEHVQKMNIGAWKVMLVWLCFNGIFGALYLLGIIEAGDLMMLSIFFFLCDYICILFYCPFQSVLMKNKCCINCRIYDWGHFMMFTPMLFIKNFYSWSLFFTSCVVLIHWEIQYARHLGRFQPDSAVCSLQGTHLSDQAENRRPGSTGWQCTNRKVILFCELSVSAMMADNEFIRILIHRSDLFLQSRKRD
jgi:hypothetical protein